MKSIFFFLLGLAAMSSAAALHPTDSRLVDIPEHAHSAAHSQPSLQPRQDYDDWHEDPSIHHRFTKQDAKNCHEPCQISHSSSARPPLFLAPITLGYACIV
ncbi:hypothetical protein D6C95_04911 [Aureobasidium pullulans]|nr:hypothetical protein D6C95_04911 [Aureobasidium pullulans]